MQKQRTRADPSPVLPTVQPEQVGIHGPSTCVLAFRVQHQEQAGVTEEACAQAPPRSTFQKGQQSMLPASQDSCVGSN